MEDGIMEDEYMEDEMKKISCGYDFFGKRSIKNC